MKTKLLAALVALGIALLPALLNELRDDVEALGNEKTSRLEVDERVTQGVAHLAELLAVAGVLEATVERPEKWDEWRKLPLSCYRPVGGPEAAVDEPEVGD
jgi:hypothetical protein